MLKVFKSFKSYHSAFKFLNSVKVLCVSCHVQKVNLFLDYDVSKGGKSKNRNRWKFYNYLNLAPLLVPVGLTAAVCDSYFKQDENRFFRAVQYGVEEEVER